MAGRKHQIHAVYTKRGKLPKPTYPLDGQGNTVVPLRGDIYKKITVGPEKRKLCKRCKMVFFTHDAEALYCLFCRSWVSKEVDKRRQKKKQQGVQGHQDK